MKEPSALRIALLLSGEGTSLESLLGRIEAGEVPGRVVGVIASKTGAGGLARASRHGISAVALPRTQYRDGKAFNDALHEALERCDADLVLLLGFLSPFELRGRYEGRALNVHPALIPAFCGKGFYGRRVHEAVIAAGVRLSGATVHFVDEEYDHGAIVLQRAMPVLDDDTPETLAARLFKLECEAYPEAVQLFASSRLAIDGQKVRIGPGR